MRLSMVLGLVIAMTFAACSGDKDEEHEHEEGPICSELSELCHDAGEAGDAEAEACHEVGHGADEAECEAQLESCRAICAGDTGVM